jgi:hypothetical protein
MRVPSGAPGGALAGGSAAQNACVRLSSAQRLARCAPSFFSAPEVVHTHRLGVAVSDTRSRRTQRTASAPGVRWLGVATQPRAT